MWLLIHGLLCLGLEEVQFVTSLPRGMSFSMLIYKNTHPSSARHNKALETAGDELISNLRISSVCARLFSKLYVLQTTRFDILHTHHLQTFAHNCCCCTTLLTGVKRVEHCVMHPIVTWHCWDVIRLVTRLYTQIKFRRKFVPLSSGMIMDDLYL